jgi:hypothetical protein
MLFYCPSKFLVKQAFRFHSRASVMRDAHVQSLYISLISVVRDAHVQSLYISFRVTSKGAFTLGSFHRAPIERERLDFRAILHPCLGSPW